MLRPNLLVALSLALTGLCDGSPVLASSGYTPTADVKNGTLRGIAIDSFKQEGKYPIA